MSLVLVRIDECGCQLTRSKNIVQIELNESLRRRRDELSSEIEGLGEPEVGDANAADDLKAQTHEISSVNNAISTLTKKVQGSFSSHRIYDVFALPYGRYGKVNRQTHARPPRTPQQPRRDAKSTDRGRS